MSRPFERIWPQRITTQIAMLVVTSLVIAHVLIAAALFALYPGPISMSEPGAAMIRLGFVAKLLHASTGADQRAEILRLARAQMPGLELGDLPHGARRVTLGRRAEDIQFQLGEQFVLFEVAPETPGRPPRIAVRLPGGGALMVPLAPPPDFSGPTTALIVTIIFFACAVALLSVWAARTLTAPLSRFADAAERFTLGRADAPLPEGGPREIVRAARALNGMRERIQRMVEDRSRMLAAISHDLRTPITRLRLRAEVIEPALLRAQVIRDLDAMQILVHSALSFLRDQATTHAHVMVDLRSLIQTVCDGSTDMGHEVGFSGPPHVYVNGDPDQLARAVTNLVENGLKFGTTVTVTLSVEDRLVSIDVRDDGPGIPDAEKSRVLEPFYRGDRARSFDGKDSFGLGLSISRAIAEAHYGTLSLHDAQPTGLRARLTLPLGERTAIAPVRTA